MANALELLRMARCPNTDCINGGYYGPQGEPTECQWCAERAIALSHAAGQEVDGWLEDWSMPGHRITRASVGPQPDPFPPKVGMTCTGTRPLYLAPAVARSEGEE